MARNNDPLAQCHGKQGFTASQAEQISARVRRNRKSKPVTKYKCPHCGQFHVGGSDR